MPNCCDSIRVDWMEIIPIVFYMELLSLKLVLGLHNSVNGQVGYKSDALIG